MSKNNHTFTTHLRQANDLPVQVQFDHQPQEKQTHDYPGCDAEVTLCEVLISVTDEYACETYDALPVLNNLSQVSLRVKCWAHLEILGGFDDER